jgi:hypothetical protein
VSIGQSDAVRNPRISARTATWLAWSLWVACVVLIALALLLDFLTDYVPLLSGERLGPGLAVLAGVLSLAYPTVGALIASRLPTNLIGWLFFGLGLLYAVRRFTEAYADYALLVNFALPWGEYVAWFTTWIGFAGPVLAGVFLMLLFPEGRLPSRHWRLVAWIALLAAALTVLGDAFAPGQLRTHPYIENPFGIVGVIGSELTTYEFFAASLVLGTALLLMISLIALCSLFLRMHRARGDERQQLKWFLYAAVPAVVSLSPALLDAMLVHFTSNFLLFNTAYNYNVIVSWDFLTYSIYVAVFAALIVPVFTYIAILKYRLYNIDILINRTLVYGSLTATLVALYFGGIVLLQTLFVALTGQQSTLAVVASTLLIAALFTPLRQRIQSFIDRRFYRRKYDAAKTLEAFSAQLRNETNLEALSDDLVGVVRETMQPAHVSLWLGPSRRFVEDAEEK